MAVFSRVKTWVSNEVLTASDLNGEFNNLLNNTIPASIEDYSADVSTMQSAADPGGVGSESLATTLAGEIQRLRYAIKRIVGGAQWYSTPDFDLTGTLAAANLASDSVTTVKILDGNVTAAKLATDSVETLKIKDLNVTEGKLADSAVTANKIATGAVTSTKFADGSITPAKRSTSVQNQSFFTVATTSATATVSISGSSRPVLLCLSMLGVTGISTPWTVSSAGASMAIYKNGSLYLTIATDASSSNQSFLDSLTIIDASGGSGFQTYDLRTTAGTFTSNYGNAYFIAIEL